VHLCGLLISGFLRCSIGKELEKRLVDYEVILLIRASGRITCMSRQLGRSKYFVGVSDSRGLSENGSESGREIITTVFRLLFCYLSSRSIARSFLVILA
jgi:hypothetical protein